MSLLNIPSDGMPSVLLALYRYLLAEGPAPEEKVVAVCAPAVVCRQDRVKFTLNTWAKLGFFARDEDEVRLSSDLPAAVRDRKTGEAALLPVLRGLVFRADNNDPFWGAEGLLAADFTRGLAWCLAMDPYRLPGGAYNAINQLANDTMPQGVKVFEFDTRWNGFKTWAVFLGFGWSARFPSPGTLMVDPARAIAAELPAIFAGAAELTQRDFLARLQERLPVLDGGRYRVEVEGRLNRTMWSGPKPGEVSASLSLALFRLKHEGLIDLPPHKHDPAAGIAVLTGRGGRHLASVSHVRYTGGRL